MTPTKNSLNGTFLESTRKEVKHLHAAMIVVGMLEILKEISKHSSNESDNSHFAYLIDCTNFVICSAVFFSSSLNFARKGYLDLNAHMTGLAVLTKLVTLTLPSAPYLNTLDRLSVASVGILGVGGFAMKPHAKWLPETLDSQDTTSVIQNGLRP